MNVGDTIIYIFGGTLCPKRDSFFWFILL